jgi:hypothetical protein
MIKLVSEVNDLSLKERLAPKSANHIRKGNVSGD